MPGPDIKNLVDQTIRLTKFYQALGLDGVELNQNGIEALTKLGRVVASDKRSIQPDRIPAKRSSGRPSGGRAVASAPDLESLASACSSCAACPLADQRTNVVFGEGDPQADLMFIGEGPGHDEDASGRPFVGRAGALLTRIIKAMGYDRSQVYIANVVKCRPPGNRDPEPGEAAACRPWLDRQIELIKPKVIVALGRVAANNLLGEEKPISRIRGRWLDLNGIDLMPTFHPSYLLRNESKKREVWTDMKKIMARLNPEADR